jgi:hypothetical protein
LARVAAGRQTPKANPPIIRGFTPSVKRVNPVYAATSAYEELLKITRNIDEESRLYQLL